MKKYKKLTLRKLSIAKLDANLLQATIKGGTNEATDINCDTNELNCQTSDKTRPLIPDHPNGPNECDPDYTVYYGPCRTGFECGGLNS